jgi:hypothetical protein
MPRAIDALARSSSMFHVVADQTSDSTGGNRSSHEHDLRDHIGKKIAPSVVIPVVKSADTDGAVANHFVTVVSADEDEVVVRAGGSSIEFDLILF